MGIIERVGEVLLATEKTLGRLAHEASAERDYQLAGGILELARAVKKLESGFSLPSSPATKSVTPSAVKPANAGSQGGGPPPAFRHRIGGYPKFFRYGDRLTKIGWSKSEKAEYEHKCTKSVLAALVEAIRAAGNSKRRFTMEEILPLIDPSDGSELPAYQGYVALAWLRSVGLVIRHGRQGYSLTDATHLREQVDDHWRSLPAR